MIAVDTNVLTPFLVADEPVQTELTRRRLFAEAETSVGPTVLLETEWVLRSVYRYSRPEIVTAFRFLLGVRNVRIEPKRSFARAVAAFEAGMDFADALHALLEAEDSLFLTFDRALARSAAALGLPSVRLFTANTKWTDPE